MSDNVSQNEPASEAPQDENKLIAERREKLRALRANGIAFPNDFRPDAFASDLQREYADSEKWTADALAALDRRVRMAGRIMARRGQGKVSFIQIQDMSGPIQIFAQANALGEAYEAIKGWDRGDIVGVQGALMRTKTKCPTVSTA